MEEGKEVRISLVERSRAMPLLLVVVGAFLVWVAIELRRGNLFVAPLWQQGMTFIPLLLVGLLVTTRAFSPGKLQISREQIKLERGQFLGWNMLPGWTLAASSIREIKIRGIFSEDGLFQATAIFEGQPRRILEIAAWQEEKKGSWLSEKLLRGGYVSTVEASPFYRALTAMGYRVDIEETSLRWL